MTTDPKALVQKLWDFCDVLRDDGLSYGDYLEQLTYLLFLKMAGEQYELLGEDRVVPEGPRLAITAEPVWHSCWSLTTTRSSTTLASATTCSASCSARPATGSRTRPSWNC